MTKWLTGAAAAALFAAALAGMLVGGAALAQIPRASFRSSSDLVVLEVAVFASGGGPALGLNARDFRVTEDGREREVSVFIGPDDAALEVALLIDASGSMNTWPVRQAAIAVLDALPEGSCVLAMPFHDDLGGGLWARPGDAALRGLIETLELTGETALYDSLLHAISALRTRNATRTLPEVEGAPEFGQLFRFRDHAAYRLSPTVLPTGECSPRAPAGRAEGSAPTRQILVVLTDGYDTVSQLAEEDVMLASWGSRIPVFAFAAVPFPGPTRMPNFDGAQALERLARYSGGTVVRTFITRPDSRVGREPRRDDRSAWRGIHQLTAALRGHYTIGFVPGAPPAEDAVYERKVELEVPDGYDALFQDELVQGAGASYGAGLEAALVGFRELAAREAESALATFDRALGLSADLAIAHYGRSVALAALERRGEALAALRAAGRAAPWLPDLDARLAVLLIDEDIDAAWEHALGARAAGSEVASLIDALQRLAPRELPPGPEPPPAERTLVDPDGTPYRVRVGLGPGTIGGVGNSVNRMRAHLGFHELYAAIGNAVHARGETVMVGGATVPEVELRLHLTEAAHRNRKDRASGDVIAFDAATGEEIDDLRFTIEDASVTEERVAFGERVAQWLVEVLSRRE